MSRLNKSEFLNKVADAKQNELWWETVGQWTVESIRLLCAERLCRSCDAYGKPEIKPGSWVHKKDRMGNLLANPHSCSAAAIWAAELMEK